jgi:hypothetical protein
VENFGTKNTKKTKKKNMQKQSIHEPAKLQRKKRRIKQACNFPVNNLEIIIIIIIAIISSLSIAKIAFRREEFFFKNQY